MKPMYRLGAMALIVFLGGCGGGKPTPSSAKALTAFSLAGVAGTIDETAKTISVTLPSGTAVTALVATFTTTGASVEVGSTVQTSGATANDFTNPVVYTVTAADASAQNYTATVTVGVTAQSSKAITAFALAGVAGTIDEAAKTIAVELPFGTDVTHLVATFTTTGVRVAVGSTAQTSGTTANDFTNPVVYSVTAADASSQDYTATVAVDAAPSLANTPQTGQTMSSSASDDGDLKKGIAWPSPRFVNHNDGTITDLLTGLMWTQDANVPGPAACLPGVAKAWQLALNYVACLNTNGYLGHSDWRLPNRRELSSVVNYGQADVAGWLNAQGFSNVQADWYWSSTTFAADSSRAWLVFMSDGSASNQNRVYGNKFDHVAVWPVRTGQPGIIELPRTGQTISYAVGDDGDLKKGGSRPAARFTDNGDQTITDQSTGLMWTRDGNTTPPTSCTTGHTWLGSLTYVACLNAGHHLGHDDWRLPNIEELESLAQAGQSNLATWLNAQGFNNVQSGWYWSSSTYAPNTTGAWFFNMQDTTRGSYGKTPVYGVWPVRAGR